MIFITSGKHLRYVGKPYGASLFDLCPPGRNIKNYIQISSWNTIHSHLQCRWAWPRTSKEV